MTEHIGTTIADGILTLTMDRPDKKNALTDAMYGALSDALEMAQDDPAVRVIMIRGEGDMFTAGNDLSDFAKVAAGATDERQVGRFLSVLTTNAKPLVAAVQGRAVGIGTTMLLHCDYVILSDDAQLTTPFVNLALVPEAASSLLLPERIGHVRAFAMFALGEAVSAADALAWGLANKAVPVAELAAAASEVARRLAKQPLGALIAAKKLTRRVPAIAAQIEVETAEFAARLKTPEAREAFTAFAERRAPDFSRFS